MITTVYEYLVICVVILTLIGLIIFIATACLVVADHLLDEAIDYKKLHYYEKKFKELKNEDKKNI